MKKVLLFGGSGLVGTGIKHFLSDRYQIISPAHEELDVTKSDQVIRIIEQIQPEKIIYAVGLTSIDRAEQEPELAYSLNTQAPALIAKIASSFDIPLLYFSTNAVFDGTKENKPYLETDQVNPRSVYGRSKLMGEQKVMNISDRNCVARIIMPYSTISSKRSNFVLIILDALKKGEIVAGINNQVLNPIYLNNLTEAVYTLIENSANGIYHLGAIDYATNLEFIRKLARTFSFNENRIKGVSFEEFFKDKKAPRAKFGWLDTAKFQNEINDSILISIEESLKLFYQSLIKSPTVPIDILR